MIPEISPLDLQKELASENPPIIIDVRDDEELEICKFLEFVHMPLMILHTRLYELEVDRHYVVICKSGGRSERATEFLIHSGYPNVRNLTTGIDGWAKDVDPSMAQY